MWDTFTNVHILYLPLVKLYDIFDKKIAEDHDPWNYMLNQVNKVFLVNKKIKIGE